LTAVTIWTSGHVVVQALLEGLPLAGADGGVLLAASAQFGRRLSAAIFA
jgi:hypothetical protein